MSGLSDQQAVWLATECSCPFLTEPSVQEVVSLVLEEKKKAKRKKSQLFDTEEEEEEEREVDGSGYGS